MWQPLTKYSGRTKLFPFSSNTRQPSHTVRGFQLDSWNKLTIATVHSFVSTSRQTKLACGLPNEIGEVLITTPLHQSENYTAECPVFPASPREIDIEGKGIGKE